MVLLLLFPIHLMMLSTWKESKWEIQYGLVNSFIWLNWFNKKR